MYDFDTLLERKHSDSTKWDALKRDFGRDDLMPFWVADSDFRVLPAISKAIRERADDSQTYGYTFAGEEYYTSIIDWNQRRHNLSLMREEILPIPGVVTAIAILLLAMTKENDKVLINPPVYTPFFETVKSMDRELVQSPLVVKDGRYELDFEDLEKKLCSGVKMYIFCSPHNPVGRVWTQEELRRVCTLCRSHNVLLVSDEIHCDIVLPGHQHTPILMVDQNAVLLTAPSKTFNIAGLKSSTILVKDPEVRDKIKDWVNRMHLYPNLFAFQAVTAAYENGADWVDEMNRYLAANAKFVVEYLARKMPGVGAYVPESTYLMWLDFSCYGLTGKEINDRLVQQARVALNPGEEYGLNYDQFVRLNIATPRDYLRKGLERIAAVFSNAAE